MSGSQPFFEGTEKKAELLLDPSVPSLRGYGDELWHRIVARSRARILSKISNDRCDAYLLSESSLFVWDHRMLMITCGRTRLPDAILALLDTVSADAVRLFVFERKNEVFPHRQPTSFFDDARALRARLPGRAFQFGDQDDHHVLLFHLDRPFQPHTRDITVEILMYGIDDAARPHFVGGGARTAADVRRGTGLADLLPGFRLDDHLFDPSGYSIHGIRDELYWTLHVTPEPGSSYVSFETNWRFAGDLDGVARRLLGTFRPRSFDLVVFHQGLAPEFGGEGYRRKTRVEHDLACGYQVRFDSYYRPVPGVRAPVELPLGPRRMT